MLTKVTYASVSICTCVQRLFLVRFLCCCVMFHLQTETADHVPQILFSPLLLA